VSVDLDIVIRNWRITRGIPSGLHVWFDPSCESVSLHRIPLHDQRRSLEGLAPKGVDMVGDAGYLDKVASVSASGPDRASGDSDRFEQVSLLEEENDLPF